MSYVKAINGQVTEYPYTLVKLQADNPGTSFPRDIPVERLAEFNVFPVTDTAKPTPGQYERVLEALPTFTNGAWTQQWVLAAAVAPQRIKSLQFRREVRARNKTSQLLTWLSTVPANVQEYFQFTDIIRQADPEFQLFVTAMGFTQQQVDQFFITAARR